VFQGRAVEAFPDVGSGRDDEQWSPVGSRLESANSRRAGPGAHAAAEDDRVVPVLAQRCGEAVEMFGPMREGEGLPTAGQRRNDVRESALPLYRKAVGCTCSSRRWAGVSSDRAPSVPAGGATRVWRIGRVAGR
jgi:hypothetical protein